MRRIESTDSSTDMDDHKQLEPTTVPSSVTSSLDSSMNSLADGNQQQRLSQSSIASAPVEYGGGRGRSYSCNDAQENEALRLKIWELESQLEVTANDRIALKSLLQESCYSEWSYLETLRKKAEEDVVNAQKVVSI